MNAEELIKQIQECKSEGWQNSNIPSGGEKLLEIIADHYVTCEECRDTFDEQEYEETTLIELWHSFMAANEDPYEWICDDGLQVLFNNPLDVYLVIIEGDPSKWYIKTSETWTRFRLEKQFLGAEFSNFELCEEPEAKENEYVMFVTVDDKIVAKVYTISE
jgi:hypothetical protein